MTCSSIIVTKLFITNTRIENGGFLKDRTGSISAIKADKVIDALLNRRLLVQSNMVQGARLGSFHRQFPEIIARDSTLSANLQVWRLCTTNTTNYHACKQMFFLLQDIGIDYDRYVSSFKHAIFPRELKLNAAGIQALAEDERWIAYYHTFPFESAVQALIESRICKQEILLVDGQYERTPPDSIAHAPERIGTFDSNGTNSFLLYASAVLFSSRLGPVQMGTGPAPIRKFRRVS